MSLLEHGICPIVCIGETEQERTNNQTLAVLEQQLAPLAVQLQKKFPKPAALCIAYEPVWAIGTGILPSADQLNTIFDWLTTYHARVLADIPTTFLYGGSVQESMIPTIKKVSAIGGLLIGGASLDFQKFKNIVSSLSFT